MSDLVLYAQSSKLVNFAGASLPANSRPLIHWREKVSFIVSLPGTGTAFPAGTYLYAFDVDRDFLNSAPCNTGECTIVDGALHFTVLFNSTRQAEATNRRQFPIPFYIQITRQGNDETGAGVAEYILDDAIWAAGCVWDGNLPPDEPLDAFYNKHEVDALLGCKLDTPAEAGEAGYVLALAEDGSTAWVPQSGGGGGGTVTWDDVQDKPNFSTVATSGSYDDLSNKPTIPTPADYIPQTDKATANGVATLDADALVPNGQLARAITTIPAATSAYTLSDGVFQHTPSSAPTYTLPAVTDATKTHTAILCVSFASVVTIAFEDSGGTTIVPLDTLTISANDVVEYLCRYDALQSKWVIACGKLNS